MGLWRCLNKNCWTDPHGRPGFDFEAEKPVCPSCGADEDDPRTARFIVRLATIHYDPPHPKIEGLGLGHPLCNANRTIRSLGETLHKTGILEQASGDPVAVNCQQCMAHADFPPVRRGMEKRVPPWRLGQELHKKE